MTTHLSTPAAATFKNEAVKVLAINPTQAFIEFKDGKQRWVSRLAVSKPSRGQ